MFKKHYEIKDEFDYTYGRFRSLNKARNQAWWLNTLAWFQTRASVIYHVEDKRTGTVVWRDTAV